MRTAANPFTDPAQVRGALYASADRIASAQGALLRARVTGRHAGEVIAGLAHQAVEVNDVIVTDLGCGRAPRHGWSLTGFPPRGWSRWIYRLR